MGRQKLRVVSYNVWGLPWISPDREARILEIGARLAALEPDLVTLQEVWEPSDAAVIGAALREAELVHQHHFGPPADGDGNGSGLWIASRYPLVEPRFTAFELGRTPYIPWHLDWMAHKGIALAEVTTPAGPVTLATLHLQSTYVVGDYGFVQRGQALQAAAALADARGPLILTGDFNAEADAPPVAVVRAQLGLTTAGDDFDIDHIFVRDATVTAHDQLFVEPVVFATSEVERTLSDHPCVVADLELGAAATRGDEVGVLSAWRDAIGADVTAATTQMWVGRVSPLVLIAASVWLWRRRLRRRYRGTLVLVAVALAAWLGYVGWSFAPYKLEVLAREREALEHTAVP